MPHKAFHIPSTLELPLSEERKEQIASLLKNSLSLGDLTHAEDKVLLSILGQLNDAEIVILRSYDLPQGEERAFRQRHMAILERPVAMMGGRA